MSDELALTADAALARCEEILGANLFEEPAFVAEALFVLLMINLKDALAMMDDIGHRVAFQEDVDEGDITDLVHRVRNAACHVDSRNRRVPQARISFCRVAGRATLGSFGELKLENPYPDDMAFFYGRHRILLRRQIARAVTEARTTLRLRGSKEGWWMPYDRGLT